jgi:protease I
MRAAILLDAGVDEAEFIYPYYRLIEEGMDVDVVAPRLGEFRAKDGIVLRSDTRLEDALARRYDVLVIPGGYAPDRLRRHKLVLDLVRQVLEQGGRVGAICHGPQVLISSGVVTNRRVTGFHSIKDDLINAGAKYTGLTVEVDDRVVTATEPKAMPEFMRTLLAGLEPE